MPLHGMKHLLAKQGWLCPAIHLALNKLHFGHMRFDHVVIDQPGQTSLHRIFVFFYSRSKGLKFWKSTLSTPGQLSI